MISTSVFRQIDVFDLLSGLAGCLLFVLDVLILFDIVVTSFVLCPLLYDDECIATLFYLAGIVLSISITGPDSSHLVCFWLFRVSIQHEFICSHSSVIIMG